MSDKKVYFYETIANPTFTVEGSEADQLKTIFRSVFISGNTTYSFESNKKVHHIEIKEFTDSHIFGMYSQEEPSPNPFMQFREKSTNKTEALIPETEKNKVLEYYTYFYVDFDRQLTAVIYNKQASGFEKVLMDYFSKSEQHLHMVSYSINDIQSVMRKFHKVRRMEYSYNREEAKKQMKTMSELDDLDLEVDSYKIELKIKKTGSRFIEKIAQLDKSKYSSIKFMGESDEAVEQSFDMIKRCFMRSAKITITDDYEKDLKRIKDLLSAEIIKVLND